MRIYPLLLYFGLLSCGLSSCFFIFQPERQDFSQYTPITMTRAELNNSVKVQASRTLKSAGKIYTYGTYLLVNERYEGIHIFNNSNPAMPQPVAFIAVPGCLDMAVKQNILYADNAIDLVALDISSPASPIITKRIENALPMNSVSPDGYTYEMTSDRIIVGWTKN